MGIPDLREILPVVLVAIDQKILRAAGEEHPRGISLGKPLAGKPFGVFIPAGQLCQITENMRSIGCTVSRRKYRTISTPKSSVTRITASITAIMILVWFHTTTLRMRK